MAHASQSGGQSIDSKARLSRYVNTGLFPLICDFATLFGQATAQPEQGVQKFQA